MLIWASMHFCQALPGSNLAPFRMEAREERKWGPQNAVCLAQNLEPDCPGIPFRIYALCQLGKNRAGDCSCHSSIWKGKWVCQDRKGLLAASWWT